MIGELIDHYRVLELLGRGNMGVVYKALDVNLDRRVAVKVMSAEVRNDPDFVERFRQEARLQGALNHPNITMLFDYFIHDGAPVVVMEFIDGESLEQMIRRRGPVPAHVCLPLFRQALAGVAAAHRAGIIHRDLKPSNLMVTREGVVKVMDFGIAKRQGVAGATKVSSTSIGSPLYMAPEQILGRAVDCRTDIYSLGLTLYQLLSGRPPFNPRGKAEFVLLNNHVNDLPEPPTVYCPDIPQPLVDAVMRALAKDPDARFQSADEFAHALPQVDAPAAAAVPAAPAVPARPSGPTGTVALNPKIPPRIGPTGTVALKDAPVPTAAPAPKAAPASGTMAIEYAPTRRIDPAGVIDPASPIDPAGAIDPANPIDPARAIDPAGAIDPNDSINIDFSAGTVWQQLHPPSEAPSPAAPPESAAAATTPAVVHAAPGFIQRARRGAPVVLAALVLVIALGALARHTRPDGAAPAAAPPSPPAASTVVPGQPAAPQPAPADASNAAPPPAATAPTPTSPAATQPAEASANAAPPAAAPAVAAVSAPAPARQGLSGSWSGAYVDASGKELLRVVNLSIESVGYDGGIEGTLEYHAATGNGECKLHARGSTWSAPAKRLQLSPEACSPHFPRELGVPLDFAGVNPQGNTLKDGRIEAPTGALIRVKLKRVSGA